MSTIRLALKAGDRIYVNGAVLEVDRKVSLNLLNKATFLLGSHVLQAEDAKTPLRQIYFVTQTLLMDPAGEGNALGLFEDLLTSALRAFSNEEIIDGLNAVAEMVRAGQTYAALKRIRDLYPLEETVLAQYREKAGKQEGPTDHGRYGDRHKRRPILTASIG